MKKRKIVNGKMFLLLVAAILILCAGFIMVGCGAGPSSKSTNYNVGNFAIDFNAASGIDVVSLNVSHAQFPSIAGDTLTVEAWIKPKASSTSASGIFGRYDSAGTVLWVKNTDTSTLNTPKFAIRVPASPTSTDYSVSSGVGLTDETWYHVAGVLTNDTTHSHTVTTSCTVAVMAESHHIDIYVDGAFKDCATTGSQGVADPTKAAVADATTNSAEIGYLNGLNTPLVDSAVTVDAQFEGVIDEVRLWTSDRTDYISTCMNAELSATSVNCNIDDNSLIGYWRFNEGSGSDVYDQSGNAVSGAMEVGTSHWSDGWVTGAF